MLKPRHPLFLLFFRRFLALRSLPLQFEHLNTNLPSIIPLQYTLERQSLPHVVQFILVTP